MPALLIVAVGALAWGIWWLPLAWIEGQGLSGLEANLSMNVGACLALGALMAARGGPTQPLSIWPLVGALLVGIGSSAYGLALTLTEVNRAVLLFYLAPAWGLLFEILFTGRKFRLALLLPIMLGLAALILVLGHDLSFENLAYGDLIALASGAIWAGGATIVFSRPSLGTNTLAAIAMLGGLALVAMVWGASLPPLTFLANTAFWGGLGLGALYLAPVIWVTVWGTERLTPMTIALVFTLEIFSGIGSAAWIGGEVLTTGAYLALVCVVAAIGLQIRLDRDTGN